MKTFGTKVLLLLPLLLTHPIQVMSKQERQLRGGDGTGPGEGYGGGAGGRK
eukprot:CAMPEP_0183321062 /NCGR_PEP_ID=MMETSP0160_2-20130417/67975_1 /TAXON_ID=2839 ORGANISM="Odontella Sinensis, Strain Grunow 1884" /NCGR_SAMPLE_ID=MMETSP0160_2 /ASSEMBLY_ACC=CAM_ASM_000250 /LENGTH=50 /DNA_ID=CAMNT_0025487913 /DNA_START=171 /DNA_END=320 /DNA_ORIENTATION=+